MYLVHCYLDTGCELSVLRALVAVLGLLCVVLLIGNVVLLTQKNESLVAQLPNNRGQGKTHSVTWQYENFIKTYQFNVLKICLFLIPVQSNK